VGTDGSEVFDYPAGGSPLGTVAARK